MNVLHRHSGFTLIEMVIVVAIVATLTGVLLERIPVWQARAEQAAMETVLGSLRSALNIQVASHIARNNTRQIPAMVHVNPMDYLSDKPSNYVGADSKYAASRRGVWYYERSNHALIYVVNNDQGFMGGTGSPKQIQFRVRQVYSSAATSRQRRYVAGLNLTANQPYGWNFN